MIMVNHKNINNLFQAHMVAAFEQSLTNMTNRLQQLTASSEQKVGNIANSHN